MPGLVAVACCVVFPHLYSVTVNRIIPRWAFYAVYPAHLVALLLLVHLPEIRTTTDTITVLLKR